MIRSLTIEEDNLSVAWAKAFLHVVDAGEIATLIVVIRGFTDGQPMEVAPIRLLLDDTLGTDKKALSCHEVANTIFPISLWNPQADRHQLYDRYQRIMPRVLGDRRNRYGVYFQRMIAFDHDATFQGGVNQLEKIIQTWHGGNRRRSAFQAAIFDPRKDLSRAERNQAVWRSKSVPLERRCSAKMSAYDGCRREPLVAARLVEPMRQGNRWLSAW